MYNLVVETWVAVHMQSRVVVVVVPQDLVGVVVDDEVVDDGDALG